MFSNISVKHRFAFGNNLDMGAGRACNCQWWRHVTGVCSVTQQSAISRKLLELETSNLVCGFVLPLLFDCRVVLLCIAYYSLLWDSTVGYPSDSLASCFSSRNYTLNVL